MRCSSCGAMNPAGAAWCGQCYASFAEERTVVTAPVGGSGTEVVAASSDAAAPTRSPSVPPGEVVTTPAGEGFRRTEAGLEWRCTGCETWHAIDVAVCEVCGTAFGAAWAPDAPEVGPERWQAARLRTYLLPGLGHLHVGATGPGAGRLVLFLIWLASGIGLALAGGAGVIAAAPLLLGAFTVYGASVVDIGNLERGAKELLDGRSLLWLVVGVTAVTLAAMVVAALVAGPAAG